MPPSRTKSPKAHWLLLLLACGMAWAVWNVWTESREHNAEWHLERTKEHLADGEITHAIMELELGLERMDEGDPLMADALELRGNIFRNRRGFDEAVDDYLAVLELTPDNLDLEVRIIETLVLADRLDEALERAESLLERQPHHPIGWLMTGRSHNTAAAELERDILQRLALTLPAMQVQAAQRLFLRACALPADDPLTVTILHDLGALLEGRDQELAEELRSAVERASTLRAEAADAFVRSMRVWISRTALSELMNLLERAGKSEEIVDFGLGAIAYDSGREDAELLWTLAFALEEYGRPAQAATVLALMERVGGNLPPALVPRWCKVLHDAKRWPKLANTALRYRGFGGPGGHVIRGAAHYYGGIAFLEMGEPGKAVVLLGNFVDGPPASPTPDARAIGWTRLAEAYRALGRDEDELRALESGTRVAPFKSGAAWLRIAELARQQGRGTPTIENAYAWAIAAEPARVDEIEPLWAEAGRLRLFEGGYDVQLSLDRLAQREPPQWLPDRPAGSYELISLGRGWLERGEPRGAVEAANTALVKYPGLLPAYDLLADAQLAMGLDEHAAETLLGRLEAAGADPELEARLHDLPEHVLTPVRKLRLMRAAPEYTGLLTFVRDLRSEDLARPALYAMQSGARERFGDEGKLIEAELLFELGAPEGAGPALAGMDPDGPWYPRALRVLAKAALETRDAETLRIAIAELVRVDTVDREIGLAVSDDLLRSGRHVEASVVLARMDETTETRGADVMLRLAVANLMAGDRIATLESIDRAEAYRTDGGPEIGRLLLAVRDRQWTRMPTVVREVWDSDYEPGPFVRTALSALEERLDEASRSAQRELDEAPEDALWFLLSSAIEDLRGRERPVPATWGDDVRAETEWVLRGDESEVLDPRDAIAFLLGLEVPEWTVWSLARIRGFAPDRLWPGYLRAVALERLGEREEAVAELELLVRGWPGFPPAWNLLEELLLAEVGSHLHPRMLAVRALRRSALGVPPGEEAEVLLTEAGLLWQSGDLTGAERRAVLALETDRQLNPARLMLARLRTARGDLAGAVEAWGGYFAVGLQGVQSGEVQEFIDLLDTALARDAITLPVFAAELEALAIAQAGHPLVPLALARLDVDSVPEHPELGFERALHRLRAFVESIGDETLDSRHPGSAQRWLEFLVTRDPVRAEQVILEEMERDPGSLDLWVGLGACIQAQGRVQDAIEHYELVRRMIPDPRVLRRLAALRAQTGTGMQEVLDLIERITLLEGLEGPDQELAYLRAISLVNAGAPYRDQGIALLANLWKVRGRTKGTVPAWLIGKRYGYALVHRGRPRDRKLAHAVLNEVQPTIAALDPAEGRLVRAMGFLALNLALPKEQEAAARRASGRPEEGAGEEPPPVSEEAGEELEAEALEAGEAEG
jgi:tetratricopeptide (TPR) repeat protein